MEEPFEDLVGVEAELNCELPIEGVFERPIWNPLVLLNRDAFDTKFDSTRVFEVVPKIPVEEVVDDPDKLGFSGVEIWNPDPNPPLFVTPKGKTDPLEEPNWATLLVEELLEGWESTPNWNTVPDVFEFVDWKTGRLTELFVDDTVFVEVENLLQIEKQGLEAFNVSLFVVDEAGFDTTWNSIPGVFRVSDVFRASGVFSVVNDGAEGWVLFCPVNDGTLLIEFKPIPPILRETWLCW